MSILNNENTIRENPLVITSQATSKKSFNKTLAKLVEAGHLKPTYEQLPLSTRQNPFTKVRKPLTPFAADLHDWIISDNPVKGKITLNDWHNARYVFQSLWSDEYYALID